MCNIHITFFLQRTSRKNFLSKQHFQRQTQYPVPQSSICHFQIWSTARSQAGCGIQDQETAQKTKQSDVHQRQNRNENSSEVPNRENELVSQENDGRKRNTFVSLALR